mmetsp:Transcript_67191/g.184281  ORF Transcript_67191/g.184281 Transcript_67191/m.184281 type:complete len:138 (+) Transcript_67191:842-1255(+)
MCGNTVEFDIEADLDNGTTLIHHASYDVDCAGAWNPETNAACQVAAQRYIDEISSRFACRVQPTAERGFHFFKPNPVTIPCTATAPLFRFATTVPSCALLFILSCMMLGVFKICVACTMAYVSDAECWEGRSALAQL